MRELEITEMLLLTVAGWALITFAVKDMFLAARCSLSENPRDPTFALRQSAIPLIRLVNGMIKKFKHKKQILKRFDLIIPLLQIFIWKALTVFGFCFLYLAINWQTQDGAIANDHWEDAASSLWLSFAISFRLTLHELNLENPMIFLVANIQFYTGFFFFGFVCFFLIALRRKGRKLQPRLYKIQYEFDEVYAPFALAESLKKYGSNNLLLILQDWEKWAEQLRINFYLHPQLVYSGIENERNVNWLTALNIILDTSAALVVTSEGALEKQARRTLSNARRTVFETLELLVQKDRKHRKRVKKDVRKTAETSADNEILSADVLFEREENFADEDQNEMFGVWRFSYENSLRNLSDILESELPIAKYERAYN
ncbi:MAG TPA: hypothetical protein PKY59_24105 [Pyrinomonadaceae bacterium]|nr:hypothetical protein [Pyrinomonadaceae bacterium]